MAREPNNLEELLNRFDDADDNGDRVALAAIVEEVGRRSFGPLLLMAGVIAASPLSGIPGLPSLMGMLVVLVAGQLVIGRDFFWLPKWMLKRSIPQDRLQKAVKWLRPPARFIDRFLRPRLTILTEQAGGYVIAVISVLIGLGMPAMEIVPFSATAAGAALTAFGLALIANDGLLAIIAFAFTGLVIWLIVTQIF